MRIPCGVYTPGWVVFVDLSEVGPYYSLLRVRTARGSDVCVELESGTGERARAAKWDGL